MHAVHGHWGYAMHHAGYRFHFRIERSSINAEADAKQSLEGDTPITLYLVSRYLCDHNYLCRNRRVSRGSHGLFVSKRNFLTNKLAHHLQRSNFYIVALYAPTNLSSPLFSGSYSLCIGSKP